MRDRERQCVYYEYEGSCLKGREGTFRDSCRTCDKYVPKPNARAARTDLRKKKMEKINRKEMKGY
jgi:hypothetical protein